MNLNAVFFLIIPFIIMAAITFGMPFYRNNIMKKAGEKIIPLVKKPNKLFYGASVTAYAVLVLSFLVDFGKMNFVIPYAAAMALYICTKEATFHPVNGIYENLLIVGSDILKYEDIFSIPESKDPSCPDNVITVITKKQNKRHLTLDNANEASEVLSVLRKKI